MTKFVFRSGLRTIGGTIVEVIDENERIIFDFGTVFSGKEKPEAIPNVSGVYENDSEYNDLVLISHLHLDHTKALNLIHPEVKVVMNEQSKALLTSLYEVGFSEIQGNIRDYDTCQPNVSFEHGNFKITNILVDHNVIGASAFLIETSDLTMLYTGDMRMHGSDENLNKNFLKTIKELGYQIDVVITEGVSISFVADDEQIIASDYVSEIAKESNFKDVVISEINNEEIMYFNPYIMDIERLESVFKLANELDREVVLTDKFAKLAKKHLSKYQFKVLTTKVSSQKVVNYQDINKQMLVLFDYQQKQLYPKCETSCALIQCGGEPLGDFDYRYPEFLTYLKEQNYTLYSLGSGGHATPENLLYIVESLNGKYTMPLHSFKPELVKSEKINQLMPKQDYFYQFENHELINK